MEQDAAAKEVQVRIDEAKGRVQGMTEEIQSLIGERHERDQTIREKVRRVLLISPSFLRIDTLIIFAETTNFRVRTEETGGREVSIRFRI